VHTAAHRVVSSALLAVLAVCPAYAAATPSTPEIEEKQSELAQVQAEMDRLDDEMSLRVEEYNAIAEALERTLAEVEQAEADLVEAKLAVASAQSILSERAEQMYRDGGISAIQVLLGTRSFEDLLVRVEWLQRLSSQDARILAEVRRAREEVEAAKTRLEARAVEQEALRDEAASQRLSVENALAAKERYAASLDDEIARLIAEEEERQKRLAQERARQAAEAARRAAEAAAVQEAVEDFPSQDLAAGPGRADVVNIALGYLGVPYAWGGSDPSVGFDCSGLTKHVFRQVGIDLPRTSRSQFSAGARVPAGALDQLVMGDLVFFGYDGDPDRVHHVGIYCGDGNFIHAPQTGDVVKVSSLAERISARGDYVGASRF
jgi:cell wall-associated NlpC family hydrolase